jgi:hypothetical protein
MCWKSSTVRMSRLMTQLCMYILTANILSIFFEDIYAAWQLHFHLFQNTH